MRCGCALRRHPRASPSTTPCNTGDLAGRRAVRLQDASARSPRPAAPAPRGRSRRRRTPSRPPGRCATDLLFRGRGDGRRLVPQQVRAGDAGRVIQVPIRGRSSPHLIVAADGGREAHRQRLARDGAAAGLEHAALASHHVAVVRHHLGRPGRRGIQPRQIGRRRQRLVAFQFVHARRRLSPPSALVQRVPRRKPGNGEPLREVLVRMPVLELRLHRRVHVPPHGQAACPRSDIRFPALR